MGLFSFLSKNKQVSDTDDDNDAPVKARRSRRLQASEDPVDPVLPEKKRARRRLIGATALVLAAIIGLPMIFDSEPKPLAEDIEIHIPSRDKAQAGIAAPLDDTHSPVATASVPDPDLVASVQKGGDTPNANPPVEPNPVQALKPAEGLPVAQSAAPSKDKPSRFVIQVAAFATKAKADELQGKLKKAGIPSYSQKIAISSGERFRIRVGPFKSREEAEKVRVKLNKLGLSGALQPV